MGNKSSEGKNLGNLGNVYRAQGLNERAIEYFTRSIHLLREVGDRRNEGVHLGNIGTVYLSQGQPVIAIQHMRQALEIYVEIGDKRGVGIQLGNLGDALYRVDRLDEAQESLRQAIEVCDESIPAGAGAFRASLALLLARQGQLDEALTLLEAGASLVAALPEEHAKFVCKRGLVCLSAGDAAGARTALKQAQEIATELKVTEHSEVGQALETLQAVLSMGQHE